MSEAMKLFPTQLLNFFSFIWDSSFIGIAWIIDISHWSVYMCACDPRLPRSIFGTNREVV